MKTILVVLCTALILKANAQQSVGIGTTSPNSSAVLDINSTSKGILVPRMTTAQRNAIASPAKGLLVFDNNYNSYWLYTGTAWKEMGGNTYNADAMLIHGQQGGTINSYNMTGTNHVFSDNSGYIYDSGGPSGNYGNNENTKALISPGNGHLATILQVVSNSLENTHDSLTISDNEGHQYILKGTTTGTFRLFGTVTIIFKSNATNTQAGFAIRWDKILSDTVQHYDPGQLAGWYFNPSRFYMRGGLNISDTWAPDSSGDYSFAYGKGNKAKGYASTGIGYENTATGSSAVALGGGNDATGLSSVALGGSNESTNSYAVSLGQGNKSAGEGSFSAGMRSIAQAARSIAIGYTSEAHAIYSVAIGFNNIAHGPYSVALGFNTRAKAYGGTVVGLMNDDSDPVNSEITPSNRIFQVGNGTITGGRSNAMTVLQNGNVGIGTLTPSHQLVVAKSLRIDHDDDNNGTTVNSLLFGNEATGEAIASKRTEGGNRWGLDFYTNSINRMSISNSGTVSVAGNLTVQNGKGLVRSGNTTQQKILSVDVPVVLSLNAGSTSTINFAWPESFISVPLAFVGNVTSGSGGWAEVVMTLASASSAGGVLYVFNPRSSTVSVNFNVRIIGLGP